MHVLRNIRPIPFPVPPTMVARFWKDAPRLADDSCWNWTGPMHEEYGCFYIGKHDRFLAHRVSYVIASGPIPDDCEVIAHRCDNPLCVNPSHLFAATVNGNVGDRQSKRRQAKGETLHTAKITELQALEIRRRYIPYKVTLQALADEFGLTFEQVWRIARGKAWKHLNNPTAASENA